ncbi:hypothetical protein HanHA300_Chr01g0025261 [Helianthus annuus]|nr:hypothetical protein HanHA300_Chr01g0025261 [Helianthus annuus]KAJ0627570.1 hypothetical protein HanHA89_Chr01g0027301 [Helianthus annuus]
MDESERQVVDAEKKALAAIKMSLPDGIKHTFTKYTNSKDMWDALEKRYQGNADVVVEEKKKAVEKKATEVSKCMNGVNELTAEVKVTSEPVSHTCHNCIELHGKVDRLSEQNKILLACVENLKESNVLLIERESNCLNKLKSNEQEINSLTSKVNELLQVIDLVREIVKDKTNEFSEKCRELAVAQDQIVELKGKWDKFGKSLLVRTQIQKSLKKSNDKKGWGIIKPHLLKIKTTLFYQMSMS